MRSACSVVFVLCLSFSTAALGAAPAVSSTPVSKMHPDATRAVIESWPASAEPASVSPLRTMASTVLLTTVEAPGIDASTRLDQASSSAAAPTSRAEATMLARADALARALSASPLASWSAKLMQASWDARQPERQELAVDVPAAVVSSRVTWQSVPTPSERSPTWSMVTPSMLAELTLATIHKWVGGESGA